MALFERRENPFGKEVEYTRYRPFVREDFRKSCAYCLLNEFFAAGKENFELDHFKPKSKFPELKNRYENIYYACHVCNSNKRAYWPDQDLEKLGYQLVDFCKDSFSTHFSQKDGVWEAKSSAATYTEEKLRLNREQLVKVRNLLNAISLGETGKPLDWDNPHSRESILRLVQVLSESNSA